MNPFASLNSALRNEALAPPNVINNSGQRKGCEIESKQTSRVTGDVEVACNRLAALQLDGRLVMVGHSIVELQLDALLLEGVGGDLWEGLRHLVENERVGMYQNDSFLFVANLDICGELCSDGAAACDYDGGGGLDLGLHVPNVGLAGVDGGFFGRIGVEKVVLLPGRNNCNVKIDDLSC